MRAISLTVARRKLHDVVESARHGHPVTLSSHGKAVAFVVGSPLELEELLSDLAAVRGAKEDVRKHGTFSAEEVVGRARWKKAVKHAVSR